MSCMRVSDPGLQIFRKSSGGRNETDLHGFWPFSFFPKTERLKGKEKKSKEMKPSGPRFFFGGVPVEKPGFAEKGARS
ncbi:hypothetical protein ACN2XU_02670 [Primorskyibacter sp. 2E107]|uniref:hypothetical protein n=1 Tax=Primorskyibacter sp. 2E107 TaxID=3403458 RepID=UPI003AF8D4B1